MSEITSLPAGWSRTTLGTVAPLTYGRALPEKVRATGNIPVYGSSGIVGRHDAALVESPALIVGRKGSVGSVHFAVGPSWPIDTVYYVSTSGTRDLAFLRYLLQHLELRVLDKSTAVPGLSRDDYNAVEIALPPLVEQSRIVSALEEHLSDLDAAVAGLERARANVKRYRASVIESGMTGALLGRSDSANMPAARIGDEFSVTVGATPSRAQPSYWNGTIPWVSSGEVAFNRIRTTRECITEAGLANTSTALCQPGTVLIGMIGEGRTRGQVAVLEIEACTNQNAAAIHVSATKHVPEFVYYALTSQYEATRRIGSGNNQKALNKSRVQDLRIPLPPPDEQTRIVAEVERRLTVADRTAADLDAQLARAARLRRAILRRAFEGRLVPQDPADEPAAALLDRMRAEQRTAPSARAGRRPARAART